MLRIVTNLLFFIFHVSEDYHCSLVLLVHSVQCDYMYCLSWLLVHIDVALYTVVILYSTINHQCGWQHVMVMLEHWMF